MFYGCTLFNQPLSNWNTSKVANTSLMFYNCVNFNQDISAWNIEAMTNMSNMLQGATAWSRTNYDLALISWANQNVKDGISFRCASQYTLGGAAQAARDHLTGTHGWTITDNGGV
jgi:surface protein